MNQVFEILSQKTSGRGLYDITPIIKKWLSQQTLSDGLLTLNILHTSASLLINENYDSDVLVDLENFFSRLVKDGDDNFIHTAEGDDDMPAHIKSALTNNQISLSIKNGELFIGTWQGIYLFEHRLNTHTRTVIHHFLGD